MRKISFFVEGQTERLFLESLLPVYLNYSDLELESYKLVGSARIRKRNRNVAARKRFYILIYETGNGDRAVSALIEKAEYMINTANFDYMIALRDLYPKTASDKHRVIAETLKLFRATGHPNKLKHVLAIMETEAWFLANCELFSQINPLLTTAYIQDRLGIDLVNDDPESYRHPANELKRIYRLVRKKYKKSEKQIRAINSKIDYESLYLCAPKISSFFYLLQCIDECTSS